MPDETSTPLHGEYWAGYRPHAKPRAPAGRIMLGSELTAALAAEREINEKGYEDIMRRTAARFRPRPAR